MKKILVSAAIAGLLAGSAALAQTAAPGTPGQRGHAMQTETRADVQTHIQRLFARLDTNHDGFVSKAEADAVQAARAEKAEQRAQRFDPEKIFARLDLNHDGKITAAEAQAAHNQRVEAKGGKPAEAHAAAFGGLFARADTNKDGVITRTEFDAMGAQLKARMEHAGMRGGFAGRMFETADVNKDGRVSVAEAQQIALQHFDRADLNHDGKVTPEERQQVRQQMRAQHKPS